MVRQRVSPIVLYSNSISITNALVFVADELEICRVCGSRSHLGTCHRIKWTTMLTARSLWGSELVHIYVGPKKQKCSVHKKLLCSSSGFFDKSFNTGFQEAVKSEMSLPEDSPYVVQGFVQWLYFGTIGDLAPGDYEWTVAELVDLYVFGVVKCSNRLKNAVMDKLQDDLEGRAYKLHLHHVEKIYANTVSTSDAPIRNFCCAFIRWVQCDPEVGSWEEEPLTEFFKDHPDVLRTQRVFQVSIRRLG